MYCIIEVQSGVLLDKLKITTQNVKCDLHKIGNIIRPHNHQHEICNNEIRSQGTQTDFVDNREIEIPSSTATNHNGNNNNNHVLYNVIECIKFVCKFVDLFR